MLLFCIYVMSMGSEKYPLPKNHPETFEKLSSTFYFQIFNKLME